MSARIDQASPREYKRTERVISTLPMLSKLWARNWLRTALVSIALFILLLIPRLSQLDALVTPDEPLWQARSANFYQAMSSGHFKDTYQFVHPGVPVMWLGALGYVLHVRHLPELMGGQLPVRDRTVQDLLGANGYSALNVLIDLRQIEIVVSALVVIALFLCLTKVTDFWAAAVAIALLALDPMHIGFTRLLHLDGLSANLLMLAVVAFSWYAQRLSRGALIVAGIVTGLACLTRAANAIAGPFFALILLVELAVAWRANRDLDRALLRRFTIALAVAGVISVAVFVLLWPAMWVAPVDTLSKLWNGSRDLAGEEGGRAIYFRGDSTFDPGWFYYPVVAAYRLGPFALLGLPTAALAFIRPHDIGARFNRRLAGHLTLFAVMYLIIVSISEKKYDRYVFPSIAALNLIAGLAIASAVIWLGQRLLKQSDLAGQAAAIALITVVLIGQASYARSMRPFYINAADPLFGGVSGAQDQFSFNWGEGGKEIAEALEQIPGIESAVVAAGPWPRTIDFYLPFEIQKPDYDPGLNSAAMWINTDYVVVSLPEIQRRHYSSAMIAWFAQQQPIATVTTIDGVYARIYDIRNVPPPDAFYSDVPKANWSGAGSVVAIDFSDQRTIGARSLVFTLFAAADAGIEDLTVQGEAIAPDGTVVGSITTTTALAPGSDGLSQIRVRVPVPTDLPEANYTLRYSIIDPSTGQASTATNAIDGAPLGTWITVGEVYIRPTPPDANATN